MRILFVSNGNGEDRIACNLISALKSLKPDCDVRAFPLVGEGLAYRELGLTVDSNPIFPSSGFLRSVGAWVKDIRSGLLSHHARQFARLRREVLQSDLTFCVGDFFCLMMGALFSTNPVVFLPTAKSDRFMPHSWIERFFIGRNARLIFARDAETAEALQIKRLPAHYLGNPMMDYLQIVEAIPESFESKSPEEKIVGLLPGSREEAYLNLQHLLGVIRVIHAQDPHIKFVMAKASSLEEERLALIPEWTHLSFKGISVLKDTESKCQLFISDRFEDVVANASLIIGLAGTANEQAIHMGKTVLCFEGFGPQSTLQRFREQSKLMGGGLEILESRDPEYVAEAVCRHLVEKSNVDMNLPSNDKPASVKIIEESLYRLVPYL